MMLRRVDCLYLTDELWAGAPDAAARQALRDAAKPADAQWILKPPLADAEAWRWWQVRPVSWEEQAAHPELFALSHRFWQSLVDELATKSYQEQASSRLPRARASGGLQRDLEHGCQPGAG